MFGANGETGVSCLNMPNLLLWDKKTTPGAPGWQFTGAERGMAAGCDSGNRCSKPPYGDAYECDAFPFNSVKPDVIIPPINRCVPRQQNVGQSTQGLR